MKPHRMDLALAALLILTAAAPAFATVLPGTIIDGSDPFTLNFDEQGNGTLTTAAGSVNAYWTNNVYGIQYRLFALVEPGDVLVTDPADVSPTNPNGLSDILHFWNDDNLGGLMYFQSLLDDDDPAPDMADIPVPFFGYYGTSSPFVIAESGPEGNNGFQWIAGTAIYNGISDVPEPSSLILATFALIGLALGWLHRRRT